MLAKWFGKLAQMIATEGTVPRNCIRKIAIVSWPWTDHDHEGTMSF